MTEANIESMGILSDEFENLLAGLELKMPNSIHIQAFRESLPEKIKRMRDILIDEGSENCWKDHPFSQEKGTI